MKTERANKRILIFVCLILFLDAVGFGLILPVLPALITELSDMPNSEAAKVAGYLLFTFAAMQFFFAPILGGLSDRFGRRPVLLIALFGYGIDFLVMAASQSLLWLFIARIISGFFGATYSAGNAALVDISSKEDRAKYFGFGGAAVGLGFIFGPAIGGLLGEYGTRIPFIVAGCLALATVAAGIFLLPESLKPENRRAFSWTRANPVGSIVQIARYPVVLIFLGSIFFMQMANHSYSSIWAFFTIEVANWSELAIGLSVAFYGALLAIIQGAGTGPAVKRLGESRVAIVSILVGLVTFIGLANVTTGPQIYFWIFIGGFAGCGFPAIQALMTHYTPEDAQGELQGAIASAYSLTAIIGPLIMSQLFGNFSDQTGFYFPGAPFYGAAVLILLCLAVFAAGARRLPHTPLR